MKFYSFHCWKCVVKFVVILLCISITNGCIPYGNQDSSDGGMGGTGITAGSIASFGSVLVNGIKFDTSKASFEFNDQPGSEDMLQVGMVVTARGEINTVNKTGIADDVVFRFNAIGAIDNISQSKKSLVIAGQPVELGEVTEFYNLDLEILLVDDMIGVSGFVRADGAIIATYIESVSTDKTVIEGEIKNLDILDRTFRIGMQDVDYSFANIFDKTGEILTEGQFVRVEGVETDMLVAGRIDHANRAISVEEGNIVIIKGPVLDILTDTSYLLSGISIEVDTKTVFISGVQAEIERNTVLQVEGVGDANGNVTAKRITLIKPSDVLISAVVDTVDPTNNFMILLNSVEVFLPSDATYLDSSVASERQFSGESIQIGDRVQVLLQKNESTLSAIRLERIEAIVETDFRGPVGPPIADPLLTILSVETDTSGVDSRSGFKDADGNVITREIFFSTVEDGCNINIVGQWDGVKINAVAAQLLELPVSSTVTCMVPGPPDVPMIASINPNTGRARQDIIAIETKGLGAEAVDAVRFGNGVRNQATFSRVGRTIYAKVPKTVTTGVICMDTSIGEICSSETFGVIPTIDQVDPIAASVNSGISMYGSGYFDVISVSFNGVLATFSSSGSSVIIAVVPVGATTGPITITAASGIQATTTFDFVVQ